jgi:hypothetical protein
MPSIDDDIDAIFADPAFSVSATFTLTGGSEIEVDGFFTDATEGINFDTGQVEAVAPSFACSSVEIADVDRGNTVTIDDTDYQVVRKERTGVGATLVHLKT